MHAAEMHRDLGLDERPGRRGVRRLHPARRRLAVRDQGRPDPRRAARARPGAGRRGAGQPGAGDPARRPGLGRPGPAPCRGCAAALGLKEGADGRRRVDEIEAQARDAGRGDGGRRLGRRGAADALHDDARGAAGRCAFAATEVVPRLAGTDRRARRRAARARRRLRPGRAVGLAAARPGQRAADRPQLLHRRPAGGAVAAGLGDRAGDGRLAAAALPRRHRRPTPSRSGLSVWGTSAMRTSGDDIAEVLALLGVRPDWDEASRRVERAATSSRSTSSAGRAST